MLTAVMLIIVMLSAIILNVVMLSFVMLNVNWVLLVAMLIIIMPSTIMLSFVMLSVIELSVTAPVQPCLYKTLVGKMSVGQIVFDQKSRRQKKALPAKADSTKN
jgi:hypothetical protein